MRRQWHPLSMIKRWTVFNSVGAMGIIVQMSVLFVLVSHTRIGYLPATALAVEAALLHNFFWHEHWTWADRIFQGSDSRLRRLLCFHLTNGLLSMAGNLILMQLFVERLELPYLPANILSIALCSILNFVAGDRLVFKKAEIPDKRRDTHAYKTPQE